MKRNFVIALAAIFVVVLLKYYTAPLLLQMGMNLKSPALIRLSISAGGDINRRSRGRTPLLEAFEQRDKALIKILLDNGADPNSRWQDKIQSTPLMDSVDNKWVDVTTWLLESGANPKLENSLHLDAMDFAENDAAMQALLKKHAALRAHKDSS